MLAETSKVTAPISSGRAMSRCTRATMPSTWTSSPPRSTANSSPPRRATTVSSPSSSRRRSPTTWSNRSPTSCPRVSLTSLNRSMSMSSTAADPVMASLRSSRCWKCSRFGSPVRGSCSARCSVSRAAARTCSSRVEFENATAACAASASKSRASSRSKVLISSSRSATMSRATMSPPSLKGAASASSWPSARSASYAGPVPPRGSRTSSPRQAPANHAVSSDSARCTDSGQVMTAAYSARISSRASWQIASVTESLRSARSTERVNV